MISRTNTMQEAVLGKGMYRGLCHNNTCLSQGARFFNRVTNAYFCRDCAYKIHKSVKTQVKSTDRRLVELEDDQATKFVSVDTALSKEDKELLFDRRTEMRMASEWYRWNHDR